MTSEKIIGGTIQCSRPQKSVKQLRPHVAKPLEKVNSIPVPDEQKTTSVAASLMGKKSYAVRLKRFGLGFIQETARRNGAKNDRSRSFTVEQLVEVAGWWSIGCTHSWIATKLKVHPLTVRRALLRLQIEKGQIINGTSNSPTR